MLWFLVLQGLGIAALGVWGIATGVAPVAGGVGIMAIGLLWAGIAAYGIRIQRQSAKLRDALVAADPDAAVKNQKQERLGWIQWALVAAIMVWILLTARTGEVWAIGGTIALFAAIFCIMLYRMFITANLDAEASRALSGSMGTEPKRSVLGKNGAGALAIVFVVVIIAGSLIDQFANLPVKVMSLLWLALGAFLLWSLVPVVWRWIRKAFRRIS